MATEAMEGVMEGAMEDTVGMEEVPLMAAAAVTMSVVTEPLRVPSQWSRG